jgi:hypothetical protein
MAVIILRMESQMEYSYAERFNNWTREFMQYLHERLYIILVLKVAIGSSVDSPPSMTSR